MNEMKIRIIFVTYQRNGVSGDPFYVLKFDWQDKEDHGNNFIATFEIDEDSQEVISTTCRIIDPSRLNLKWRGDVFAHSFNQYFNLLKKRTGIHRVYQILDFFEDEL